MGWRHAVLNLDDTVAITQNFVGYAEFDAAWQIVRRRRKALGNRWLQAMKKFRPELYARAQQLNQHPDISDVEFSSSSEEGVSSSSDDDDIRKLPHTEGDLWPPWLPRRYIRKKAQTKPQPKSESATVPSPPQDAAAPPAQDATASSPPDAAAPKM